MRQIPLDLRAAEPPSFENFVPGSNQEALAALRVLAGPPAGGALAPSEPAAPSIWLWGDPGAGKTHLLAALATELGERALPLDPGSPLEHFRADPGKRIAVIDDCDQLDAARQEAAFHLYNRTAASGGRFVAAGLQPPLRLELRDDLRTRLGWGVVMRLALLSDDEKADALRRAAKGRGLRVPDELVRYLLTHRSRDIRALLRLLDALDRFALERKRAITLPLLRELEATEPLLKSQ
jgi:DnaA family protein